MSAVTKPFALNPTRAHAATASAPALVGMATAHASAGAAAAAAGASAAAATRPMWAPMIGTIADDEFTRQSLNAAGGRRIQSMYQRKTESVTSMQTIEQQNRQALTLIPSSGIVAV